MIVSMEVTTGAGTCGAICEVTARTAEASRLRADVVRTTALNDRTSAASCGIAKYAVGGAGERRSWYLASPTMPTT